MPDPDAILHTLWRQALLFTASESGASAALARVLRAQADVLKLSEDRRRRLLVLGASEWSRTSRPAPASDSPAPLRCLVEQAQRLAFVARDAEQWGEIEASRALGLPKSAITPLLDEARQRLRAAGHEPAAAAALLRSWSASIDPRPAIERLHHALRAARARRRIITALQLTLLFAAMAVIAWIGRDLLRASERERDLRALNESISNPMPPEEAQRQQLQNRSNRAP